MTPLFSWLFSTLDERIGLRKPGHKVANKVFPDHWSFLLGEMTMFAFILLVATGAYLTMFYRGSADPVVYDGSLALYQGVEMPEAYASILRLTYDVPGGLLFRRIHLGAAYLFVAGAAVHMLRIVLTGAFRKPREVNYHVGVVLLVLAIAAAYTGQNLRYDLLAGTSLRIAYAFLQTVPFIGEQLVGAVFGGPFPGEAASRFYVLHILVLPGALIGLIGVHLALIARQRHTQFPHAGVDGRHWIVGKPLWPHQFAISTAWLLAIAGVLALFSVAIPWADVTLHGPLRLGFVSNSSWPDWWLFWVQGALTTIPAFEFDLGFVTIHNVFVAGVAMPLALIGLFFAWPWIDRRIAPYEGDQHVLQRPLEVPARAAAVAAVVTWVVLLSIAAANPVYTRILRVPVEVVVVTMRVLLLTMPVAVGGLVYWAGRRAQRVGNVPTGVSPDARDAERTSA